MKNLESIKYENSFFGEELNKNCILKKQIHNEVFLNLEEDKNESLRRKTSITGH